MDSYTSKRICPPETASNTNTWKKRRRLNNKATRVFDSDLETDEETSEKITESMIKVLHFLNTATESELVIMPSVPYRTIEHIIQNLRPFNGWDDLVNKLEPKKFLSVLNGTQKLLEAREAVSCVMRKCERITKNIENAINVNQHSILQQPSILNTKLKLQPYQMVGLSWLNLMNMQKLSGILADEMGLGKTIQVIAFLAYLKETGLTIKDTPHLIVVPSTTLENWCKEFDNWCPSLKVFKYYGSPENRKSFRSTWRNEGFNDTEVVLTTYTMIASCCEERKMFQTIPFHYVVFDEAHVLKNMKTQRYKNLIGINALRRLCLTGTPLQNNLLELMSLLNIVMPDMFSEEYENLKLLLSKTTMQNSHESSLFEREQIERAKIIIRPFLLRRLKLDVLNDCPPKTSMVVRCAMEKDQAAKYAELLEKVHNTGCEVNSMTMMMNLRKISNHPLTLRYHYQGDTLNKMAQLLSTEMTHKENDAERIMEDLMGMSDYQLHKMVKSYNCVSGMRLPDSLLIGSGKFRMLDEILPTLKATRHKVVIFSQFVFMLDIIEEYLGIRDHKFLRLDGSTPVCERQDKIDEFNQDDSIFVFLLSTRAGGIGINLTAADTVIIHDVDFNPHNDRQAEDRCHRMGQTRPVTIMRLVSEGTIEEAIMSIAEEKLHLEREVTSLKDHEVMYDVSRLLRESLRISNKV